MAKTTAARTCRTAARATVLATALVTGCGVLQHEQPAGGRTTFELAPVLSVPRHPAPTRASIYVAPPRAAAIYATSRIIYSERAFETRTYARNEWAAEPAHMLEAWLVAALEATGAFAVVTSGPGSPLVTLRLDIEILDLRQDFGAGPSVGRVRARAQITDVEQRRVLAARDISAVEPAPSEDAYGGVQAINRALGRVLTEVAALAANAASDQR